MKKITTILLLTSSIILVQPVYSLEVDREVTPRITIGGRIISNVDIVDLDSDPDAKSDINIDDSLLLTRFDKRLYGGGVAGAILGLREEDKTVQFHEASVFYWNQDMQAIIGQTRLRNTLIEFPTIRDEDLLSYSHVGNASSNKELDQLYGKLLSFDWYVDRKNQALGIWMGTRDDETGLGKDGLDTHGLGYNYEISEDLFYVKRLRKAGVMIDRQKVYSTTNNEWMTALIAGAEFNININPLANWSMGVQAVVNDGVDRVADLNSVVNRARAKSWAFITAIRYTSRPKLLTRWQSALNIAYKDYTDFNNASQWTLIPNFIYKVGQGVDLLGQISYTDYDDTLVKGSDTMLQLGIAFSFDTRFNDRIGERNSILNMEHGYID